MHTEVAGEKKLVEWTVDDIDALLVLSFGGPEGVDEVRPFLENVTRGRGIPPERLDTVGEHYYRFGGVSPLNALNREIIANVEEELSRRELDIPVYFGNRNWKPYAKDVVHELAQAGYRRVAVFATSAWGGYSGCKQYDEDIAAMIEELKEHDEEGITFFKLRQFFDHPTFIKQNAYELKKSMDSLLPEQRENMRVIFTAHSIPVVADKNSGTPEDGTLYSNQVNEASHLVAEEIGLTDYDVVWQSASGNGKIPWLEPDVLDYAEKAHEEGISTLVVCCIGFISDHMEVIWDLDSELAAKADELGMTVVRAATIGPSKEFAGMVVDLLGESLNPALAPHLGTVVSRGCSIDGNPCAPGCCQSPARPAHGGGHHPGSAAA